MTATAALRPLTAAQITHDSIVAASQRVLSRLSAEFEQLKVADPKRAASFDFGFGNSQNQLGPDGGPHKQAPIKYLINASGHVRKFYHFLPYLAGMKRAFEIGVGPGHLFRLLKDAGCDMLGCDIEFDKTVVYCAIRKELGIADQVLEFPVQARTALPLADNTEAIVAFWTAYNNTWTVADHEWFFDYCRDNLVGRKSLYLRFNRQGFTDHPAVIDLYEKVGEFPFGPPLRDVATPQKHMDNFCIVRL